MWTCTDYFGAGVWFPKSQSINALCRALIEMRFVNDHRENIVPETFHTCDLVMPWYIPIYRRDHLSKTSRRSAWGRGFRCPGAKAGDLYTLTCQESVIQAVHSGKLPWRQVMRQQNCMRIGFTYWKSYIHSHNQILFPAVCQATFISIDKWWEYSV